MQPRMTSPAYGVPGVLDAAQALGKAAIDAATAAGVPRATFDLIGLRASQINGCAACLDLHTRAAKKAGETDERLHTLAGWRDSSYFNDAERAVLALTEAGTRLADRTGPIPDDVYQAISKHFDETAVAAMIAAIAAINAWNRLNVVSGQVAGEATAKWAG